ncbi:MAG TPA: hypothetical protein VGM56_21240 [Byssovorax sp.]
MLRLALFVVLSGAFALGCTPAIGDSCELSTDCSQLGDRLCDTTEPSGYCTIFNCEPDTCPDSVCVGFNFQLDPTCGTADDGKWGRFERTFCMAPCTSISDCRTDEGYTCIVPASRNGRIVDQNPVAQAVCATNSVLPPAPLASSIPGVCEPGDAGADIGDSGVPWTPYDAGAP